MELMVVLNFSSIQRELLVAVRGRLSQTHLNRKLGLRSNHVHRWESGQSVVPWKWFCRICVETRRPLEAACRDVLGYSGRIEDSAQFVRHLIGKTPQNEIAQRLEVSRSMISRWTTGKVEPSLEQVMRIMSVGFFSFENFLTKIVPEEKLPSLAQSLRLKRLEQNMHFEYPWVAALLLYLRTVEYNRLKEHKEGFLAKKLGISVETEREVMKALLAIGAIKPEGKIYAPSERFLVSSNDREGIRNIRAYWTRRALKVIEEKMPDPSRNNWGHMVLNTSPETYARIRELYYSFFQQVNSIIQLTRSESEQVYLLNVQLLNVDDI